MRDVIFRGKSVKTGEWVSGFYCNCSLPDGNQKESGHYIVEFPNKYHEIYTDTVGQYTGLKDKTGTRIFENGYMIIDNQTYKVKFDIAEYILANIFNCDTITLKENSIKGVFVDEI